MGKASSSKKVARAAGTGGGRTNRGKAPVLWYTSLVVVLVAGIGLTAFSRQERQTGLKSATGGGVAPKANADHWHTALGVYVCDHWLAPATKQEDPKGIHTHGDGIIHVHPYVASASGKNATVARFQEAVGGGAKITATSFTWPVGDGAKKETHENGQKCGDKEAEVVSYQDGKEHKGTASDIKLTDRGKIVLAFVPKGTTYEQIGDPPSTANLEKLTDVAAPPDAGATPGAVDPNAPPGTPGAADPAVSVPTASSAPPPSTPPSTPASTPASTPPSSTP